jgi:UDP-N-acetyl-D-galactosamine dehydrogenase
MTSLSSNYTLSVIGLGYVGLPVAVSFGKAGYKVIAFDINQTRIDELKQGIERTHEVEPADLSKANLVYTSSPEGLRQANFHIVTVPTPIDGANQPDLTPLRKASETLGRILKKGDIVVYESTVYPGATVQECVPILEHISGLTYNVDFFVGYSPERINPGDKQHRFETIQKIVSGSTPEVLETVAAIYGSVVTAGIHKAPTIETAEAAKVIENVQRDLNIALINEIAMICGRLGIDTNDVIDAAGTKWNFIKMRPGLVGGHCIGVDPYYLTHCAEKAGYHPEVILSGRRTNTEIPYFVASEVVKALFKNGSTDRTVTILGCTFKENVPDIRNSRVFEIMRELERYGVTVQVTDPEADFEETFEETGIKLVPFGALKPASAVIVAVSHEIYVQKGWSLASLLHDQKGLVFDLKAMLAREEKPDTIDLWRL